MNSPEVLLLYYYLRVIEDNYWGPLNMWLKKKKKRNAKMPVCKELTSCVECHSGDWECRRKAFSDKHRSQNKVRIKINKQRAFGGWRSRFVPSNIIWTWLVLLPPVGPASLCWHFAVICKLQIGPFSLHQKCFFGACVRMSLVLTFSSCQIASARGLGSGAEGEGCFVP